MKKTKIIFLAIIAIFITGLFFIGCTSNIPESKQEETDDDEDDDDNDNDDEQPVEGILILQAYASSGSAAGATHSFVELYNTSEEAVDLNGVFLYFADGHKQGEGTDTQWDRIPLKGTIPAGGSFLVTGHKQNDTGRLKIPDDYGDIIDPYFTLSNRAFKAALIQGTVNLNTENIQNPFDTDGEGTKVSGYLDMVGAVNDPAANDVVLGFETAPARCSASEAVRRKNLTDTDDNSSDFISARYGPTSGDRITLTDNEAAARSPRNSSAGKWDPFAVPKEEDEYEGLPPTQTGAPSAHAGNLLILQIAASQADSNTANVSHSFIELYNKSNQDINLAGISLQYAEGNNTETKDKKWQKIDLTGTIKAGHSFLILGDRLSTMVNPALDIAGDSGDINNPDFVLSNRAVKAVLIQSADLLTVQNPFDMDGQGAKAAGYIDMIGVVNDTMDRILGLEGTIALDGNNYRISQQIAIRRLSLEDTDNNVNDFGTIRYNQTIDAETKAVMYPKNGEYGKWNPFPEPEIIEPEWPIGTPKLMILQANTHGNADGGFSKSLVELYNNTNKEIDLDTGNYYLHIGENATPGWTNVFKLTGIIPAYSSFVIISNNTAGNTTPRTTMPAADREYDFVLTNNGFKAALMINQSELLTAANPFTELSLSGDYIDMLGVTNTATGFETAFAQQSRPQLTRRNSLTDTNNNSLDFTRIDIRSAAMQDSELYKYWPRNSAAGAWNPMTGESIVIQ